LYLHLSIGDVWNTINNIERRFGVAVTGVLLVWLSKAHAAYQYGRVNVLAGRLVAATLIWLTIATALVTATWRLNPDPATGKPEPLYPVKGKAETTFAWFSSKK
jgi:translocator protein